MSSEPIDLSPRSLTSLADVPAPAGRTMHWYKVPKALWGVARGIRELGFAELTPDEEMAAAKRTQNVAVRLAYEQALESLRGVGMAAGDKVARRAVSTMDGSADQLWGQMHPKIRALCATAYAEIHHPTNEVADDFLASREISAG